MPHENPTAPAIVEGPPSSVVASGGDIALAGAGLMIDGFVQPSGEEIDARLLEARQNYTSCEPAVTELLGGVTDPAQRRAVLEERHVLLGSGDTSDVARITVGGSDYAARFIRAEDKAQLADAYARPMAVAKGVEGADQLVAYHRDEGVVVAELIEGKEGKDWDTATVAGMSDETLGGALDTMGAFQALDLVVDPSGAAKNMILTKDGTIVSYDFSLRQAAAPRQPIGEKMSCLANALINSGGALLTERLTSDYYAHAADDRHIRNAVVERLLHLAEQRFGAGAEATLSIAAELASSQQTEADYRNPAWVAQAITAVEGDRAQRAADALSGPRIDLV